MLAVLFVVSLTAVASSTQPYTTNITTTTIDSITIAMAMYGIVGFETLTTNNWYGAVNDNDDKKT